MIALIDGLDINYQLSGSGRDILLLHGWGVDSTTLAVLFEHLAERFRVCSVDLPGFGQSQAPKEVWGVGEYADFVTKLLHYVDFKDPVILGHSFGGRIAILLGARGVAAKLILADSAGIKPARSCGYYLR
ncbi:MAG: alpha/beta hydrolase, partial [Clostridiales bacterium]